MQTRLSPAPWLSSGRRRAVCGGLADPIGAPSAGAGQKKCVCMTYPLAFVLPILMYTRTHVCRKPGRTAWAVAFALATLGSTQVMSDDGRNGMPCNNATIRGDYGIQMEGTRPTPPPTDVIETVVGVLLRSFDGDGNFEQVDNIKGSVTGIVPDRPGTGTYEVFPDCSGVTEFQPDPNNPNLVIRERFVILDNGNEIWSMAETPAPLMVTTVGKRVRKR